MEKLRRPTVLAVKPHRLEDGRFQVLLMKRKDTHSRWFGCRTLGEVYLSLDETIRAANEAAQRMKVGRLAYMVPYNGGS